MSRVVCGSSMPATVASVSRASAARTSVTAARLSTRFMACVASGGRPASRAANRVGVLEQLLVGHHSPGDAQREQSWCVVVLAEEQHFAGLVEADEGGQQRGHCTGDEDVERYLGEEPGRAGGPDREVAVDGPFESAADGPAVDRADYRLRSEHDRLSDLLDRADQGAGLGLALWLGVLFAVVSGAEGPSGAGEDDGAGRRILVGVGERPLPRRR